MKTSVELNDEKVALAKKLGHVTTLKELLDQALEAFINQARRQTMADLLGTDFIDESPSKLRKKNGSPSR